MAYEPVGGSLQFRDLAERLRRLEELLANAPDGPLQALVTAAQADIPGASAVSITTLHRGRFITEATSDPRALDADLLQYSLQSGPCVDAVLNDQICNPRDLAQDARWPQFGPRVSAELGFNSCLSYRLAPDVIIDATAPTTTSSSNGRATPAAAPPGTPAPPSPDAVAEVPASTPQGGNGRVDSFTTTNKLVGHRSSLNVYGDGVGAFSQDGLVTGLVFATYAVSLITVAYAQDTIHHLEQTLVNARQIGVAIGILMNAHQLTQDDAFNLLRIASQHSNRKVSVLAADVALTGALPVTTVRDRTHDK